MRKSRPKPKMPPERRIELRADGWERFVAAVDAAAKSGPKHKPTGASAGVPVHRKTRKTDAAAK